jgi:hypothetical protein
MINFLKKSRVSNSPFKFHRRNFSDVITEKTLLFAANLISSGFIVLPISFLVMVGSGNSIFHRLRKGGSFSNWSEWAWDLSSKEKLRIMDIKLVALTEQLRVSNIRITEQLNSLDVKIIDSIDTINTNMADICTQLKYLDNSCLEVLDERLEAFITVIGDKVIPDIAEGINSGELYLPFYNTVLLVSALGVGVHGSEILPDCLQAFGSVDRLIEHIV